MTLNSWTDCTTQYETTLDDCTCPGFQRWSHCKHNETLCRLYAKVRRETFEEMREQFDVRSDAVKAARREAYCADFAIYG